MLIRSARLDNLSLGTARLFRIKAVGEATSYGEDMTIGTPQLLSGAANGDGVVNALNITKVERIIAGWIEL